jgi:hypothetical protein
MFPTFSIEKAMGSLPLSRRTLSASTSTGNRFQTATSSLPPPPAFGMLAVRQKYISEAQLNILLATPLGPQEDDGSIQLANLCLKRGFMTPEQVQDILLLQHYYDQRFEDKELGALAVKRGWIAERTFRDVLDAQHREYIAHRQLPRRLGEMLVEMDALTSQQMATLQAEHESSRKILAVRPGETAAPARQRGPTTRLTRPSSLGPCGWLLVEEGDRIGRRFPLVNRHVIGRPWYSDIEIGDPLVSRRHASLEYEASTGQVIVTDLESRNGTYLNEEAVQGPVALRDGDCLRIGSTVLRFEQAEIARKPHSDRREKR